MSGKAETKRNRDSYKLWFDMSILVPAHVFLLPLWALLWTVIPLLIWIADRGPVFYRQERAGQDGETFVILKFRTMVLDADLKGPAWTSEGDPRVTPVGKFLRRMALDELPGVLSIWRRDMSLVGPRALDIEEQTSLERQIPRFERRLKVLPGLTGLAQVYNRTDDAYAKFRYDQEYLDRMGPWLDTKLLFLSVWKTLTARWDNRSGKSSMAGLSSVPLDQPVKTADKDQVETEVSPESLPQRNPNG